MRAAVKALAAALAGLALTGCVMVVDPSGVLRRGHDLKEHTLEGEGRDKIVLVDITGLISDRPSRQAFGLTQQPSVLARVDGALRRARKDDRVRAVVLRVDSPGGTVAASDELYARIRAFRADTGVPVVAALGGVAASGAYYAACAADVIVAQPATVTGSIGVILVSVNFAGLMEKLGVQDATYTAGANKALVSPLRTATPAQRAIVQTVLDGMHARFRQVVVESRPGVRDADLPTVTDGRILGAQDALAAGLVDRVGRLHDALALARELAGVKAARVVQYAPPGGTRDGVYAHLEVSAGPGAAALAEAAAAFTAVEAVPMYLWAPGLPGY